MIKRLAMYRVILMEFPCRYILLGRYHIIILKFDKQLGGYLIIVDYVIFNSVFRIEINLCFTCTINLELLNKL